MVLLFLGIHFAYAQKVVPYQDDFFVIRHFRFSDGSSLDSLRLHYYYLGTPHLNKQGQVDNAVLIMHGTGGSGESLLTENFAGYLFRAGEILDAEKYFIILPDAIGHGKSSKPSDGKKMHFPAYTYDDMVDADYLLLKNKLQVQHARLIMGTSMGAMHTWIFGYRYPDFMDALLPLASLPVEIGGRNRILRKMVIDAIKEDPAWNQGNYVQEPALGLRHALDILMIMSSAPLQWQKEAPTRQSAEAYLNRYLLNAVKGRDANDMIYQFDASRDYNPAPYLSKIKAPLLAINSADDQINPPELKILDTAILKVPHGKYILLPISSETRGHGTHSLPKIWGNYLKAFLEQTKTDR
ncbi:MAG TPA: alpha/beta fold hydrolase [Chitinophagaceae bacterium]|nr:alpha/beta fold hydrolase [Chitinophagaceae bacterium]